MNMLYNTSRNNFVVEVNYVFPSRRIQVKSFAKK